MTLQFYAEASRISIGRKEMKRIIGKAGVFILSVIFSLIAMETAVRLFDILPSPMSALPIATFQLSENPVIRYEYIPNLEPTRYAFDSGHECFVTNDDGFRDYSYDEEKPSGVYRIIVLGDSTTAGNDICDMDDVYVKRLERMLNKESEEGLKYEALNMGVGGYFPLQEAETLRVKGLSYDPDFVIMTLCCNDFDLVNADGGIYDLLCEKNPRSVQRPESRLYNFLLRRSRLVFVLHHRTGSSPAEHDRWYQEHVLKGKNTVEAGLALLSRLKRSHGFELLVVLLPFFKDPFDEYKFFGIHKDFFRAAEGLDEIQIYDLTEKFAWIDNDASKFSFDGCHMNEYGHKTMAEILMMLIKDKMRP